MVGIIDIYFHPMQTRKKRQLSCANCLCARGVEIKGQVVVLTENAALPEIGNCSGTTGFYLSSELEVNGWFRSSASGLGAPHQLNYQWLDQAILFY